jgi:leader peptidase (prepilin peptidase) / N-methyltransferase
MVNPKRCNWPLRLALLTVAAGVVAYVFGWPVMELWSGKSGRFSHPGLPWIHLADQIRIRFFETMIMMWIVAFGSSLGSFLNVVVYRTPQGLSLLGSSFCPKCKNPIRWFDNIPIFGWILLRGRCRDCHLQISVRYPLIELVTGLMVLGLVVFQVVLDAGHLPGRSSGGYPGLPWLVQHWSWELVTMLLAQAALLCILLSGALIRWDGHRLPSGYLVLAVTIGLIVPVVVPALAPMSEWYQRLGNSMIGLAVGGVLGAAQAMVAGIWGQSLSLSSHKGRAVALDLAATVALIGAFLGWHAAVSTFVLAAAVRMLGAVVTGDVLCRRGSSVWLYYVLATFLQIVGQTPETGWIGWPAAQASLGSVLVATGWGMYFSLVAGYVESREVME